MIPPARTPAVAAGPRSRAPRSRRALRCGALLGCVLLLAASCGDPERVPDELWERGNALIGEGDPAAGVALIQQILDDYPDSRAAERVRADWSYFEEWIKIDRERLPNIAADDLRRIGKALEAYRSRRGRYPEKLEDMVPANLEELTADPWGRAYLYRREGRGYVAETLGGDGERGGSGPERDIRLVHGILQNAPGIRRLP